MTPWPTFEVSGDAVHADYDRFGRIMATLAGIPGVNEVVLEMGTEPGEFLVSPLLIGYDADPTPQVAAVLAPILSRPARNRFPALAPAK